MQTIQQNLISSHELQGYNVFTFPEFACLKRGSPSPAWEQATTVIFLLILNVIITWLKNKNILIACIWVKVSI
jgi:hypothetical protein